MQTSNGDKLNQGAIGMHYCKTLCPDWINAISLQQNTV